MGFFQDVQNAVDSAPNPFSGGNSGDALVGALTGGLAGGAAAALPLALNPFTAPLAPLGFIAGSVPGAVVGGAAGASGVKLPNLSSLAPTQDTTNRLYCPPGYPKVLAKAGKVGPEWGSPLADALGLHEGDSCPNAQGNPGTGLYCPTGYPNVLKPNGRAGPEWGSPVAASLGLKEGDPCPGYRANPTVEATVWSNLYCPPGYPNVLEQAGQVGPEWGKPFPAATSLRAGDPCPGTQGASQTDSSGQKAYCPPGYQRSILGPANADPATWGSPLFNALADQPCLGTMAANGGNIQSQPFTYDQYGNPIGGGVGNYNSSGIAGGLGSLMGMGGGGGLPDWFWMLWLIEHMNDSDKSKEHAARDWANDTRNPVVASRTIGTARTPQYFGPATTTLSHGPANVTESNPITTFAPGCPPGTSRQNGSCVPNQTMTMAPMSTVQSFRPVNPVANTPRSTWSPVR